MKKTAALPALAILLLAATLSAQTQTIDFSKKPLQSERSRSYDAIHYRIKLAIDIEAKSFAGETTVVFSALTDGLTTCVLDAEEYTVSSVLSDYGAPLRFEQSDKELKVTLARPYRFGEITAITCFYKGSRPKKGLQFPEETPDNPRLVYSDSFPDNVHHWFPCFDYPNDKATNETIVTVKSGYKVAANGRLDSVVEDKAAGTVIYHYSQELPHSTYLMFFAAAPYVVVQDFYKSLPVNYWVYPQDEAKARPTYGKTPEMIEFFNKTFGYDYPWQKYDQISVPSGGGAESTSATAMTQRIMVGAPDEAEFTAIGIVSHELAHQWWGDLITLRSWAHTWLNESFGTYSDYLYFRHAKGDDEGAVNLLGKLNSYLREAKTRYIRPIVSDRYDKPGDMFDSHTYPKGALVLHMLRTMVGDEVFFATLSHYLHHNAFQPADTADFIRSVKTVTGQNFDWFFDQWLFKPGHPVFDVKSEWDAAAKVLRLKVAQVQDFSRGIPVFRVPVAIKVVTAKGPAVHKVWIREREETFEFPAETKPLLVRFDEGNTLIKEVAFPKDLDELVYQLKNDDVIGRQAAAAEMLRFKAEPRALAALEAAAGGDPFWSVRRGAVEALAAVESPRVPAVLRKAAGDARPVVRAAAVLALGERKDKALIDYYKGVFQKDASPRVRAEVLRALGKTGDAGLIPFLKQAGTAPSHQNMVKRAADAAVKMLEKK
jgi:aminopeptidase N